MQFIITAYDGTDPDALERRMSVRPRHLENIRKVQEEGHVICAGGILDDEGKMKGSFLVMDFDSRKQVDDYLAAEPYVTGGVWEKITVDRCNVVITKDGIVK